MIFGPTHRPGPLTGEADGWLVPSGPRLTKTGSWVYEPLYLGQTASRSPHWPGTCVFVADSGPPRLHSLLEDLSALELEQQLRPRAGGWD